MEVLVSIHHSLKHFTDKLYADIDNYKVVHIVVNNRIVINLI